jgi:hypothetical protein
MTFSKKTFRINGDAFNGLKAVLNGWVFWREAGDMIEVQMAVPNKTVLKILTDNDAV